MLPYSCSLPSWLEDARVYSLPHPYRAQFTADRLVDTDLVKSGCSSIGWAYTPLRECSSNSSMTSQHIILLPSPCSFCTTDKLVLVRHFGKSGGGTSFVHTLYQYSQFHSSTLFTFSVTLFQASRFSYCKLLSGR